MVPSSLAVLANQIETDALDVWGELAGLMAADLTEKSLEKMHQPFVEHQKELHAQLRGPAATSIETELGKIEQGVAGVIERINVLRTALKPVWARKKKAAAGSLSALPIGTIEKLERRRTELMEVLRKLARAAEDLRRALDNPPTTSADPANGDDNNREASLGEQPVPHARTGCSEDRRCRIIRSMSPLALSAAEDKVWQAFPRGEPVDLSAASDRKIRAEVISELLLGAQQAVPGKASALRLTGARITGSLELPYTDVTSIIWLGQCELEQGVKLEGTTRRVVFHTCRLPGLAARGVRVDGQLSLYGSQVDGTVALLGATINGELNLSQSRLLGHNGLAISAARLTVGGNLLATDLEASGRIELSGAQIAGNLDFSGAQVRHPGDQAIAAERIAVGDQLNFSGFRSEGQVMLRGGRIDGQVLFSGAHLANPGRYVLHASAMTVGDSLYLWQGFTADGEIVLRRSRINGAVNVETSGSIVIYAGSMTADIFLLRVGDPAGSSISLRQASVRQLRGSPDNWPSRVSLDGLSYETLDPQLPVEQRLEWLRRDGGRYVPQPYEQLSAACRRLGDDAGARQVQLARQRMRRGTLKPAAKSWGYLQDWTVGYGYQPARAVAWLLVLLIVGTVVFSVSPPAPLKAGEAPHFNAFIYTLDLLLPIVGLGQRAAWNPAGAEQWLTYLFIAAGWLLATSVAAGITRALTRN